MDCSGFGCRFLRFLKFFAYGLHDLEAFRLHQCVLFALLHCTAAVLHRCLGDSTCTGLNHSQQAVH